MRACQGLSFNGCPGESVETETCNEVQCPTWSDWSNWSGCSATCDGGIQSRTRQCQNGEEGDCPGSASSEQQCNRRSCDGRAMVYWHDHQGFADQWSRVQNEYLPVGETYFDRCFSYCLGYNGCIAALPLRTLSVSSGEYVHGQCFITTQVLTGEIEYFKRVSTQFILTPTIGVTKAFYEQNPQYFPIEADGYSGSDDVEIEGLCDETNTGFGMVGYRKLDKTDFRSMDDKNVIRDSGSTNCAAKCFETAGCSSFYVDDDGCTYVIGHSIRNKNDAITEAGMIHDLCPTKAFTSTFIRRSQFFCLIWAPNEADNIADSIVRSNTANSNTPLRAWSFETKTSSGNPMYASSQYVSVSMPNMSGTDRRYRPVIFSIETHVRVGQNQFSRRRRSVDRESELISVGEISSVTDEKIFRQFKKEAKKVGKQRSMMPRTDDILAEIAAIERQATSFILDGGMDLPDGVEVAATGPVETVEFVQTVSDGSVAADCSSGSCECSAGFIDNGNGCEEMTEEQAATTQAATTQAPATTQAVSSDSVRNWIPSLINKVETVLEDNRPGKPRNHLMKKWQRLSERFLERFESISDKGCDLNESYEDNTIDFSSVDTCEVNFVSS